MKLTYKDSASLLFYDEHMHYQEKKYRVEDFDGIIAHLKSHKAKLAGSLTATHYYAQQAGTSVTKIVEQADKIEIHVLHETAGKFSLREKIAIGDLETGKNWLKSRGFSKVAIVKMFHADYEYKEGIVGLYTINDWLHSVILDYPEGEHETVEQDLALEHAAVISLPYDKYLEMLGKLRIVDL